MRPRHEPPTFWDLYPGDAAGPGYEEYAALFRDAYLHAFDEPPAERAVDAYLHRYLRFRLVPPWVRAYVREVKRGNALDDLGDAPLDPAVDLRRLARDLRRRLLLEANRPGPSGGPTGWLDA